MVRNSTQDVESGPSSIRKKGKVSLPLIIALAVALVSAIVFIVIFIVYQNKHAAALDDFELKNKRIAKEKAEIEARNKRLTGLTNLSQKMLGTPITIKEKTTIKINSVEKHVLICFYGQDIEHQKACEILEANAKETQNLFHGVKLVKVNNEIKTTLNDIMSNNIGKFLNKFKQEDGIRVTTTIFCHGHKNTICGNKYTTFYDYILAEIRKIATQLLVVDTSCYAGDHLKTYLDYTKVGVHPNVEIYISASCEGSRALNNGIFRGTRKYVVSKSPFMGNLSFDLFLGRICFPSLIAHLNERAVDEAKFVDQVLDTRTFGDLEKIFSNYHRIVFDSKTFDCRDKKNGCYSYHVDIIHVFDDGDVSNIDIDLKSWFNYFNENYNLISVFRSECGKPKIYGNGCIWKQVHFKHVKQFVRNPDIYQINYFLLNKKTFSKELEITKYVTEYYDSKFIYFWQGMFSTNFHSSFKGVNTDTQILEMRITKY